MHDEFEGSIIQKKKNHIKNKKCLQLTDCVAYVFLNCSSDLDGIWYRDSLVLREEDKLHSVAKKGK